MNALKLFNADFGIDLGGGQIGMAKQLLDEPDIGTVFEHVGGATMAEHVAASGFDAGLADVSGDQA